MNEYTIYDKATGRIEQIVSVPESMLHLQYDPETQALLPGWTDDANYYIRDGERVPFPEQPSPHHVFDWSTHTWVDPRTLTDLKAAKWAEIKLARSRMEFGGFEWDGSLFDSDRMSQSRIQGAAQLAQITPSFTIDWTLADNTVRTLTAEDMIAVGLAMGQHVNMAHAHARDLRAQIDTAHLGLRP